MVLDVHFNILYFLPADALNSCSLIWILKEKTCVGNCISSKRCTELWCTNSRVSAVIFFSLHIFSVMVSLFVSGLAMP